MFEARTRCMQALMLRTRYYLSITLFAACTTLFCTVTAAADFLFTVKPGDNPWTITRDFLRDMSYWIPLQEYNDISDAQTLVPGSRLKIPLEWLRRRPALVTIVTVAGEIEVRPNAAGEWQPGTIGMRLGAGAAVRAGTNSNGTLRFANGSEMSFSSGSEIVLDSLSAFGRTGMVDTRVRLQRGRVETRARPLVVPEGRFEIDTPTAVTAVRGTVFRVGAEAEAPVARSEVIEGRVAVSAARQEKHIPGGFGVVARAGQPLPEPKPLLPAADLPTVFPVISRPAQPVRWPALVGASAYRVQIAEAPEFRSLQVDARVTDAEYRVGDIRDGRWYLRVRGIDNEGLEGLDAVRDVLVNREPAAPTIGFPADGQMLKDAEVNLQWAPVQQGDRVRVEVSADRSMASPIVDRTFHGEQFLLAGLQPGEYFWRLTSISERDGAGPAGPVVSFRVQISPVSPEISDVAVENHGVRLVWPAVRWADRYQVQISTRDDQYFDIPEFDGLTGIETFGLDSLPAGRYHVRVRAITADDEPGPWSSHATFSIEPDNYWPALLLLVPLLL